ncbi:Oxidoreductase [Yamadazyma tenuis]|uniref:Mitochondrial intermembrane space import and assembly protein 40 n=1 Tax=Candida tenuis (strain ATCC 10573 / BCRC 21748 / CBS 615 / JCM 9827 / NBRC 10315 / NRRL Y-1498 / VKM Y-70) TaxID=590646 RepID=G3B7G1_CANTC|nr:uncharacterized protein CANTEDRAFT_115727 [Yamadazyma tenuis ATCC 10573]EGV62269.1 hypothetical protein CANTEDRAFT_115727 [Yamadazyma tenuis ATCC 10573]WEJ93525.1 Oxidoreductase [Yamadazyma tenuis]
MIRTFVASTARSSRATISAARSSTIVRATRFHSSSPSQKLASSLINNQTWMGATMGISTIIGYSLYASIDNDVQPEDSTAISEQPAADADKEPTAEDYEGAAYNPITGEINWDCPCLGGMAHGPCGEEFKEAFACFVYSETEPKGIDCIKKFEGMRTCFRRYPEHYKEQLMDEEEMEADARGAESDVQLEPVEVSETVSVEVSENTEAPAIDALATDATATDAPATEAAGTESH